MRGDCPGCPPDRAPPDPPAGRRPTRSWLALASGVLLALLPKCPLCLVTYLSLFGVTLGAASVALSVLRPLGLVLALVGLASLAVRGLRAFSAPGGR